MNRLQCRPIAQNLWQIAKTGNRALVQSLGIWKRKMLLSHHHYHLRDLDHPLLHEMGRSSVIFIVSWKFLTKKYGAQILSNCPQILLTEIFGIRFFVF